MSAYVPARQMRFAVGAAVLLLVAVLGGVLGVYGLPSAWRVDAGEPGDAIALLGITERSWHNDEADFTYRYRWTTGDSKVLFQDVGSDSPVMVSFRGQGFRPAGPPPVVTVTLDSRVVATHTVRGDATEVYTAGPVERRPGAQSLVVGFETVTFQGQGDPRQLGFKLDWVEVAPAAGASPGLAPPRVLLASAALALGLFALLLRLLGGRGDARPVVLAAIGALIAHTLLLAGLYWLRPLITPWLSPAALTVGLAGLLAALWPGLRRWPEWVDGLAMPKGYAAATMLALALLAYGLFGLAILPGIEDIGHADYADNAVVARNFAAGRGLVVDYAAQFYTYYPGITHPADTWPLFQPIVTAPFFLLFGAETWVAKLPNLLLLLLLAAAVFAFGSRWWDKRVGLLAALLTLLHPYFFQAVLYPISDLAFALFALLALGWIWEASSASPLQRRFAMSPPAADEEDKAEDAEPGLRESGPRIRTLVLAGIAAALLVWSKAVSGLLLLLGPAALLSWDYLFGRWAGRRRRGGPQQLVWFIVPFLAVLAPLVIRNLLAFGLPFYSTEAFDAWILRYTINASPPWEDIYRNYLSQAGYGGEMPNFRWVLGGLYTYDLLFRSIWQGFQDLWNDAVLRGSVLDLSVFLAGLAGWLLAPRRLHGLARLALAAFVPYALFVLLAWHYESRYFQLVAPWGYLGAAGFLFWVWDGARRAMRVREEDLASGAAGSRAGRWSLLLLPLAVAGLVLPSYFAIGDRYSGAVQPDDFAAAGRWAAANLPADAVVMTRNPWEFNWYAQRKAVMIPTGTLEDVRSIGELYGVTHVWLGGPVDSLRRRPPLRLALAPLYEKRPLEALPAELVYENDRVLIYRLAR